MKKKKTKPIEIKIQFANKKAAQHFMSWLSNSGEQQYWDSMEYRETKEDDDITSVDFDYDFKKHTIKTTLGRITKDD